MYMNNAHSKAATTVDLADGIIAILAGSAKGARWEVYTVVDGLETFSHYATPGEARQIAELAYGASLVAFAAQRKSDAVHFGLVA
jgi:hypothetical protein